MRREAPTLRPSYAPALLVIRPAPPAMAGVSDLFTGRPHPNRPRIAGPRYPPAPLVAGGSPPLFTGHPRIAVPLRPPTTPAAAAAFRHLCPIPTRLTDDLCTGVNSGTSGVNSGTSGLNSGNSDVNGWGIAGALGRVGVDPSRPPCVLHILHHGCSVRQHSLDAARVAFFGPVT